MKNVSSISKDSKYESCQKKHTEKKKNLHIKKNERNKQKQEFKIKQMLTVFYFSSQLAARVRNVQAD